jgi:glycosyltransferase involved in cell wall biosynthesis
MGQSKIRVSTDPEKPLANSRIAMILNARFPPDIRVEKEADVLVAAGADVTVISRGEGSPQRHKWNSIWVLESAIPSLQTALGKAQHLLLLMTFVDPAWKRVIETYVRAEEPHVIHVHDLLLVKTALKAVEGTGVPVIADLHENYPAAVREWRRFAKGPTALGRKLLSSYSRWLRIEGVTCRRVDHIIAVVEEMKQRLISQHGVPSDKVTVITNTERTSFVNDQEGQKEIIQKYGKTFTLLYIGGFGPHRGLETAIEGMKEVATKIAHSRLVLVGRGSSEMESRMHDRIQRYGLQKNVELVGWQPFEKVASYMKAASVGLVPHNANEHTNNTVPHKLFQYMMVGLPVLVSSCKPLARIVTEIGSGLVFDAGNPDDFACKVMMMFESEEVRRAMGKKGVAATLYGSYNWETTGSQLVSFYRKFLSGG